MSAFTTTLRCLLVHWINIFKTRYWRIFLGWFGRDINECTPIHTVRDLLAIQDRPMKWWSLVEPLKSRSVGYYLNENFHDLTVESKVIAKRKRPQLLICHDFRGNYLSDKYISGAVKFDDYRFYNWAGCDIFCYFSHHFITIPTLQWLNVAHKHGVKVLGTFIVESRAGQKILNNDVLQSIEVARTVADALVFIAKQCNFEGWLINVECLVDQENVPILKEFLNYLTMQTRQLVPNGMIIWYDSVINDGILSWQNELNDKNRMFFEMCDGIFLNYTWGDNHLTRSNEIIERYYPNRKYDVFVGIDVFGRGQVAQMESHKTFEKIRANDFSVAIFAPGWTLESLLGEINIFDKHGTDLCNKRFIEKNDKFWKLLWPHMCTNAVQSLPFYTAFCLGSGKFENRLGRMVHYGSWFNLSKQELQISIPGDHHSVARYFEDCFDGGSCLKLTFNSRRPNLQRLFVTDFDCSCDLLLAYAIKRETKSIDMELILHITDNSTGKNAKILCNGNNISHVGDNNQEVGQQVIRIQALDKQNVREVISHVQQRRERHLPGFDVINDWEIRHFYLSFDTIRSNSIKLTDIGVRIFKIDHSATDELSSVLFGAISINEGFPSVVQLSDQLLQKKIRID